MRPRQPNGPARGDRSTGRVDPEDEQERPVARDACELKRAESTFSPATSRSTVACHGVHPVAGWQVPQEVTRRDRAPCLVQSTMSIEFPLAVVAVLDLAEAKEFYTRLLGRPADLEPMPTLAQWDFTPAGALQVVQSSENPGQSMVTLMVSDFDHTLAGLGEREVRVREVISGVISRVTQIEDPAGNTITLAEIPDN